MCGHAKSGHTNSKLKAERRVGRLRTLSLVLVLVLFLDSSSRHAELELASERTACLPRLLESVQRYTLRRRPEKARERMEKLSNDWPVLSQKRTRAVYVRQSLVVSLASLCARLQAGTNATTCRRARSPFSLGGFCSAQAQQPQKPDWRRSEQAKRTHQPIGITETRTATPGCEPSCAQHARD